MRGLKLLNALNSNVLGGKHMVVWAMMLCDGTETFGAGITVLLQGARCAHDLVVPSHLFVSQLNCAIREVCGENQRQLENEIASTGHCEPWKGLPTYAKMHYVIRKCSDDAELCLNTPSF
jgi:hypothetical protein